MKAVKCTICMLATLQNEPDSLERTITPPEEGENGRRLGWGNKDVDRAGVGEKERCLLSQCAGAEIKLLVLKETGRN